MATTQYTYEQVRNGFHGLIDYLQNPLRVYGAARSGFWSGKITGTEAKMLGRDYTQLFEVSVDGGAYVDSSNASGVHTLFTGLADVEHDVSVRIGPPFGYTNGYWVIDQSYLLEVTGVTPSVSVLDYSWSAHSADLISSGVTEPIIPSTYTPELQRELNVYDESATSKVMFSTNATELLITLGVEAGSSSSLYYNIDGATPIIIPPSAGNVFKITGLSGTHTYNIRAGSNTGSSADRSDIWSIMADAPLVKTGARLDQFGDSITHGVGAAANPIIDIHNAAAHFGMLGQTYATSGWTVNDLLVNLDSFNLTNLVEVGDIALMAIGRNSLTIDTDPTIQADYESTITGLLAAGYSRVLCRGILAESGDTFAAQNAAIEAVVTSYADARVEFIDVSSWIGIATQDGVHPSVAGYGQMVEYAKVTYEPFLNNQPDIVINVAITGGMPDGTYRTVLRNESTDAVVLNADVAYVGGTSRIVLNTGVILTQTITGYVTSNEAIPLSTAPIKAIAEQGL
jgi:lysophospholipase L1-like esterase